VGGTVERAGVDVASDPEGTAGASADEAGAPGSGDSDAGDVSGVSEVSAAAVSTAALMVSSREPIGRA
jgi:hypothetical protein